MDEIFGPAPSGGFVLQRIPPDRPLHTEIQSGASNVAYGLTMGTERRSRKIGYNRSDETKPRNVVDNIIFRSGW